MYVISRPCTLLDHPSYFSDLQILFYFSYAIALLQAPLNLTLVDGVGRLAISWLPNPLNEGQHIVGYKINWDHPSRLVQSAATSVPISNMQYTTESINLSLEYGVLVWAFNELGDGLPAKATWTPKSEICFTKNRFELS